MSPGLCTQCLGLHHCALSHWEDLSADDLVIIADSLEECVRRLLIWKEAIEEKGLRVKCRKDNDHDLRYRLGPPAELRP